MLGIEWTPQDGDEGETKAGAKWKNEAFANLNPHFSAVLENGLISPAFPETLKVNYHPPTHWCSLSLRWRRELGDSRTNGGSDEGRIGKN